MKITRFEDLEVWQQSINLVNKIYSITNISNKFDKDFSFKSQIRRAVISIPINIAEGFERNYNREFIRFLKIARGSLGELRTCMYIARQLKYIEESTFHELNIELLTLSKRTGKLINYLKNYS